MKLNADGTVAITTGSVDLSGSHSVLQQIAGEELGVGIDKVGIITADTDTAAVAPLSAGSNIIRSMGWTVKVAAEKLREQILEITAGQLEANIDDLEIRDGRVQVKGTPDRGMSFQDVYKIASMSHGGPPVASAATPMQGTTLQYAPQVAEVEVDPETGDARCPAGIDPQPAQGRLQHPDEELAAARAAAALARSPLTRSHCAPRSVRSRHRPAVDRRSHRGPREPRAHVVSADGLRTMGD